MENAFSCKLLFIHFTKNYLKHTTFPLCFTSVKVSNKTLHFDSSSVNWVEFSRRLRWNDCEVKLKLCWIKYIFWKFFFRRVLRSQLLQLFGSLCRSLHGSRRSDPREIVPSGGERTRDFIHVRSRAAPFRVFVIFRCVTWLGFERCQPSYSQQPSKSNPIGGVLLRPGVVHACTTYLNRFAPRGTCLATLVYSSRETRITSDGCTPEISA